MLIAFGSSIFVLCGCGSDSGGTPAGAIVGRANAYNYSPSVIQSGNVLQFWWCGSGKNPYHRSELTDNIWYETIDRVTQEKYGPVVVLAEGNATWDATYTCNPHVIRGRFVNPLGDAQTYSYEMFYVGSLTGVDNSIGVAFSNDGVNWSKYPDPIIPSTSEFGYGVGQPVAYNADGNAKITLFYEDSAPTVHHLEATSEDGVHFTVQGSITNHGLELANPAPTWGDMGYDSSSGYWYAAFDLPTRPSDTTGNVIERGEYGFQLYRIPNSALLSGARSWELVKTVDTNLTGYESNFLPSFLHDGYGNINVGSYPKLEMFTSTALPQPHWDASPEGAGKAGDISKWAIAVSSYDPGESRLTFSRYHNEKTYVTTTGWIDPDGKFVLDRALGHLYSAPRKEAVRAIYACKAGSTAYFASVDPACNGQRILGLQGYGYANAPVDISTVALYSCTSSRLGTFVSREPGCEGSGKGTLLAYALP
jgi:hypothetical protein